MMPTPPSERTRPGRTPVIVLLVALLAILAVACGSSASTSSSTDAISGSITISAAASLQSAFTEIRTAFGDSHPGVSVALNFGASSTLAQQILDGAPVDVFASADEANMTKVSDAGLIAGRPTVFATNSLEIIVRRGNPSKIASLSDLSRSGLVYVTCAPDVPIGRYAAQVLAGADVTVRPSSLEPDVKGIVGKVTSGEADAGIVYATDVTATNGAADGVVIPSEANLVATYPIATIGASSNGAAARAWIEFVMGPEGRSILHDHGFGAP